MSTSSGIMSSGKPLTLPWAPVLGIITHQANLFHDQPFWDLCIIRHKHHSAAKNQFQKACIGKLTQPWQLFCTATVTPSVTQSAPETILRNVHQGSYWAMNTSLCARWWDTPAQGSQKGQRTRSERSKDYLERSQSLCALLFLLSEGQRAGLWALFIHAFVQGYLSSLFKQVVVTSSNRWNSENVPSSSK